MDKQTKTSWLATIPEAEQTPLHACARMTMPFRDVEYGQAALPKPVFSNMVYHYVDVYRRKDAACEPTIYPTSDIYMTFGRTPQGYCAVLVGPRSRARRGEYVTNDTAYFVVSLSYLGSYAFLPVPQNEILDRSFALEDIFSQWPGDLARQIGEAPNFTAKVNIFENFLGCSMDKFYGLNSDFADFISRLGQIPNYDDCLKYTKNIGYTQRHLQRLFLKYTGVSPRKYARILRCQTAMKALAQNPKSSLAQMALEFNYFDQAHFNKEFKAFYNFTPRQFIQEFIA